MSQQTTEQDDYFNDTYDDYPEDCWQCGGERGWPSCPEDCCPNLMGEEACTRAVCWQVCDVCKGKGVL